MTDNNDNVGNDPPEDDLADTYIIFAQANTWKSPNASHELAYYVDNLMRNYKLELDGFQDDCSVQSI